MHSVIDGGIMSLFSATMGIPASGKTTWARREPATLLSLDVLREDRGLDRGRFVRALQADARQRLAADGDVVIDSCLVRQRDRMEWLAMASSVGCATRLVVVYVSWATALARNSRRPAPVPYRVMAAYRRSFQAALGVIGSEGWGSILSVSSEQQAAPITSSQRW